MKNAVRFLAIGALVVACASAAQAVEIQMVSVGNPGNEGEVSGAPGAERICGAVDYIYSIGRFEVTAAQYTEFLNAVAATDPYGLYNTNMFDPVLPDYIGICNIQRSGSPGSYIYSVAPDWADRPVNLVSWGDAARFANWLHNGQPTGAQDLTTTEDGSYFLDGAMNHLELAAIVRQPDATWVIPSEDEWYKAAYHYNDGVTGNYYDFATSSDSSPSNDLVEPSDPGNNATFYISAGDWTIGSPYYRTEVGAHENSESPYGTYDQAGNVKEWTDIRFGSDKRIRRGGGFNSPELYLRASLRMATLGTLEYYESGFRVAEVSPGPVCGNGAIEDSEECDDNNTDDGDGCSSACSVEDGWNCTGEPSTCTEICRDGIIVGSEGCDDNNTDDGDGCSSTCTVEDGFTCQGEPSVCFLSVIPVPTVSEWGLVVLTLLLLTALVLTAEKLARGSRRAAVV